MAERTHRIDWHGQRDMLWQALLDESRIVNKRLLVVLRDGGVSIVSWSATEDSLHIVLQCARQSIAERIMRLGSDMRQVCLHVGASRFALQYPDAAGEDVTWWCDDPPALAINGAIHESSEYSILLYDGFRFRSRAEVAVYAAFRLLPACMVFPNATAMLTGVRLRREIDLLIIRDGKVGILEINGRNTHPNAAQDHARARLFRSYGVHLIEYFDATECLISPHRVVRTFLAAMDAAR